jgi:RNA polymerase sigma-70 factor (ECF subfamily)
MLKSREPPDSELVASVLAGDRDAFGVLYDRYARLVRAVVHRVASDSESVNDLAQECFLRAYRNLGRLRQADRFGPWVVGIARQVAREHRRSKRRDRHEFVSETIVVADFLRDPCDAVQADEEIALLLDRLTELPERERLAVHAFFLLECDANEAAAMLRLSRSGIYALLGRALARLAASLRPVGITKTEV